MALGFRKQSPPHPLSGRARCALLAAAILATAATTSCAAWQRTRLIHARQLESATPLKPADIRRAVVRDPAALASICRPLNARLALLQVRNEDDWKAAARAAPELGPCPDLDHGIVVGLVHTAGLPLDGHWPLSIDEVRLVDGAAMVEATFEGGTFLADTTAFVEAAHVPGLRAVLIVDVDGTRFYP